AAKDPRDFTPEDLSPYIDKITKLVGEDVKEAYKIKEKAHRREAVGAAKKKAVAELGLSEANPDGIDPAKLGYAFKEVEASVLRRDVLKTKIRIDGRALDKVRPIVSEVGVLPRTHGSALFTRGETQALVVATLGTGDDEQ